MAVKRNGLGKGLDSLIPNKTVKTTEKQANKTQKEKVKVEKSGETIVKITQVEPNSEQPRKDFDEDAFLSWQILSNSLAYFSHFWYKRKMIIMKSLQEKEDGERQSLPD